MPIIALLLVVLLAGGWSLAPDRAHAAGVPAACEQISERAAEMDGRVSVVLLDLQTGDRCLVDAGATHLTASLYKVILLAETHRLVDAGELRWDDVVTVRSEHQEDAPARLRATYTVTVREAVAQMIRVSENASALALREHIGKERFLAAPGWLGMPDTALGDEFTTTASDIARLFSLIYHGQVVSPEASADMYALLSEQEIRNRLPRELPAEARLAHKTGDLERSAHDAGIITGPGGSIVLVVLTDASERATVDDGYDAIAEIAEIAYAPIARAAPTAGLLGSGEPPLVASPVPLRAGEPEIVPPGQSPAAAFAALPAPVVVPPVARIESTTGGIEPWWLAALGLLAAVALFPGARFTYRRLRGALGGAVAPRSVGAQPSRVAVRSLSSVIPISGGAAVDLNERDVTETTQPRGNAMRFGARNARDDEPRQVDNDFAEAAGAGVDGAPGAQAGVDASERLGRLAGYFEAQGELLREMSAQVHTETQPLGVLLMQQRETMGAVLRNLETRLRPLQDYAASEEANLVSLEQQMTSGGMDFVARSFADYLDEQRRRIAQTRDQIDEQRRPFEQYGEQQEEAVEVALSRFDEDLLALETNLAEQRKVMMRMLDAMRSETFVGAREFLAERELAVRAAAEEGVTDPGELAGRLRPLRERVALGDSEYAQRLLAIVDAADHDLLDVARQSGGPVPVPAPAPEAPAAADEADTVEDEQSA